MKKTLKMNFTFVLAILFSLSSVCIAFAEEPDKKVTPDSKVLSQIISKADYDYGFKIAKEASLMGSGEQGFRTAGSTGEKKAAAYIEKAMKDLGLSNVRQDKVPVHAWNFEGASLDITKGNGEMKSLKLSSYAGSVGTPNEGLPAEIVYVGDGSLKNYENLDVKGKIVLAEFDMNNDYWVTQPSYQAELKGASAFIVAYNGPSYGTDPEVLNSFDVIARDAIPIMNISRNDASYLKDLINKGAVEGTLKSKATIDKNGQSANVIGEIPGKQKDKYIVLGAHYDGYFNAFQDDILGVGVFMSVAKAILDSGYQPEHTIIFSAFGAEEYGITNSHYDWIRGSWYQINYNTPNWSTDTTMFLNFDTQRPDMKEFVINVTPVYKSFFEDYSLTLNLPEPWVDGAVVKGTNGPWSDDYNFISKGIPGLISGKGNTEWKFKNYHTNKDDYTIHNPVTFEFNVNNYIAMTLSFDKTAVAPLNFGSLMEETLKNLDSDIIKDAGLSDTELRQTAESFLNYGIENYKDLKKANIVVNRLDKAAELGMITKDEITPIKENLKKNSKTNLETYKMLEQNLTKLDSWDVVTYGHEIAQTDLNALINAKAALVSKDADKALKAMGEVQFGWMLGKFDKEVYRYWGIEAINPERTDLYWGNGKTIAVIDLYDVYDNIASKQATGNKEFDAEIKVLNTKINEATNALKSIIAKETDAIKNAMNHEKTTDIKKSISDGEALLAKAYETDKSNFGFSDVNNNSFAYPFIMGLKLDGVVLDEGKFNPQQSATRLEVAKWLTEAFNLPLDAENPNLKDVGGDDAKYVAAVKKAEIMQGNGMGLFNPDKDITKAELATIAVNLLDLEKPESIQATSFSDVSMSKWYAKNVEAAYKGKIISGTTSGEFQPEKSVSKAEAAIMIDRMLHAE